MANPIIENRLSEFARMLGRKGGSARSDAKTIACRANAKKGGWPKGRPRAKHTGGFCPGCQVWKPEPAGHACGACGACGHWLRSIAVTRYCGFCDLWLPSRATTCKRCGADTERVPA